MPMAPFHSKAVAFVGLGTGGGTRSNRVTVCRRAAEWRPEGLLSNVVNKKLKEMEDLEKVIKERPDHPLALRANFSEATATRGATYRSLRQANGRLGIIAELKNFHPVEIGCEKEPVIEYDQRTIGTVASTVEEWGCDAALIWTDNRHYGGDINHLAAAKEHLTIPLIRGDFIVHPLQIAEAALCGAQAVLLIAGACLPDLEALLNAATLMGLEAIVEVHSEIELSFAVEAGASIIMLSNFDRRTNSEEPGCAERLKLDLPEFVITIAGGGYSSGGECWDLLDQGFDAVMLGRTLFNSRHGEQMVKEIKTREADIATKFFRGFGYDPDAEAKPFEEPERTEDSE